MRLPSQLSVAGRLAAATTLVLLFALRGAIAAPTDPGETTVPSAAHGVLWDDDGTLRDARAAASLRARIEAAARRAGIPIAVAIVGRRAGAGVSLEELGQRMFAERRLSDDARDAVLLVVSPHLGRASIETGKGAAGIVPEIDARRITSDLQHALGRETSASAMGRTVGAAVDGIAASALATLERRRPLARENEDDARSEPAVPGTSGEPGTPPSDSHATTPAHRSVYPAAAALAGLVLVGLGLRQRRRDKSDDSPAEGTRRWR